MRLRDKVAAMFDASGSSCSSDEAIDVGSSHKLSHELVPESSGLESRTSTQNAVPLSESPALHVPANPAPQRHPSPVGHILNNVSSACSPSSSSFHSSLHCEMKQRYPHATTLLMLRKGALDCLGRRSVDVPKNAISLLLAASNLILSPDKLNWEYVKSLIQQRRYVAMLSRVVLEVDPQSPSLLLARDYLSKHVSHPVFQVSSEAAHALCVIHNWLVECLAIIDGSALHERPSGQVSLDSSKATRLVRFQAGFANEQTGQSNAHAAGGVDIPLLSRFFSIWRFNSRQQFRMQMVHDAALLHHRVGRYNFILTKLLSQRRVRQCLGKLFAAWAFRTRTFLDAKSRSINHTCRICAKMFTSWRFLAVWRIHVDKELDLFLLGQHIKPNADCAKEIIVKASGLAASVVSMMFPRHLEWPNISVITKAINHQRILFASLSDDACFDTYSVSGPPKQTLKSLFHKTRNLCVLSEFFRSWNHLLVLSKNQRSSKGNIELSFLDGDITEVIAGACVSLGRSQPLLLGYCALKSIAKHRESRSRWRLEAAVEAILYGAAAMQCEMNERQWPEWVYRAGILQKDASASAVTPEKSSRAYLAMQPQSLPKSRNSESPSSSSGFESHHLPAKASPRRDKKKVDIIEDIARSVEYELSQAPFNISDSRRSIAVSVAIRALQKMHPCQNCFRAWKRTAHALNLRKQDVLKFMYSFRAWKNHLLINRAQADAAEAKREKDDLEIRYQEEINRLKEISNSDLQFEREQFNLSITDIAGLQKEDIRSLAEQYKAAHRYRIEQTEREHSQKIRELTIELDESRSLLEDTTAELMVANGIAAAASAQAQEHLKTVRAIQSELKSAKMGLLLQQEQLKQQEADLQFQQSTWMQDKSSIEKRHQDCEQELNLLRQKLSHGFNIEDQALSVRSIVATSRALHPCSRAFFAWATYVRKQQRIQRQHAPQRQNPRSFSSSHQMNVAQSVLLRWREYKCRSLALMHVEVAVTCLILHRRLKNFFGLWSQTAFLSTPACIPRFDSSPHNLLRSRVAKILINSAIVCRKHYSQLLALLSHVIHAFSNVSYSTAFLTACASFKSMMRDSAAPSNLSPDANDLFLLFSACLKWIIEENMKSRFNILPWNHVLGALSEVSSKYSKFVSIISNSRFRTRKSNGSHLTIRNLRSSNFEFDLLLLLSRSVVMLAADEIYDCMSISIQKVPVQRSNLIRLQFFCGFLSCIRGYKQTMDAMIFLRQQVLVQILRRLQGGLLISKVYVNCLVCFHLSEEIHQAALLRSPLDSMNQSFEVIPPPPSTPPISLSPEVKWWFSDEDLNRHGPYTLTQLKDHVASQLLNEQSLVWHKGMADWKDAAEVPAIKSLIEANSTLSARSLVTDRQSYSPEARHSASQRGDNRSAGAASPFASRPGSISPLGFNLHRGQSDMFDEETSVLSDTVPFFSSPGAQVIRQEPQLQPMKVLSKDKVERRNRIDSLMSLSPPPQAVDLDWSTFFATKATSEHKHKTSLRFKFESPYPPPPPPPDDIPEAPVTLQDVVNMKKIVEMQSLLFSQEETSGQMHGNTSMYTSAASLRKLRHDWILGGWIKYITQASLAFHLWRQRCLPQRAAAVDPKLPNTPSHSPFIPNISITSPDVHTPVLRAGSKSTLVQNQHSALSPIQQRTLSTPTPARVVTTPPMSRHSFPPLQNYSILPKTQTTTAVQLHSNYVSPQLDGRSPSTYRTNVSNSRNSGHVIRTKNATQR